MTSRYSCAGLHTSTDKLYSQTLLTNFTHKLYSMTHYTGKSLFYYIIDFRECHATVIFRECHAICEFKM